jgi:hypothetical protein
MCVVFTNKKLRNKKDPVQENTIILNNTKNVKRQIHMLFQNLSQEIRGITHIHEKLIVFGYDTGFGSLTRILW